MACCDIDFNPVTYIYLNPELGDPYSVEDALDHYYDTLESNNITYGAVGSNECKCEGKFYDADGNEMSIDAVQATTGYYSEVNTPGGFNYKVYYLGASNSIEDSTLIPGQVKQDLADDLERLSIIHYRRHSNDNNYPYRVDPSFNELLYRTFEKNTTLDTEEELYIDYLTKKKAGSNVIGMYDDLMMTIMSNIEFEQRGSNALIWDGTAVFNNDVWFTKQVYFGPSNLEDSNFNVTFQATTNFTQLATFDEICAKSVKVKCDDSNTYLDACAQTLLAVKDTLVNFSEGAAVPGAAFGKELSVFDKPVYFRDAVYFGDRIGGVCACGDGGGGGGVIDPDSNIVCNDISCNDITCTSVTTERLELSCASGSNLLTDISAVRQTMSNSSNFQTLNNGIVIGGSVFTEDMHVITKPVYFTQSVTFGACVMQGCCSNGDGGGGGGGGRVDVSGDIVIRSFDASYGTVHTDLDVGGDVEVKGDLTLEGALVLGCSGMGCMDPSYVPVIREAVSNADNMIGFTDGLKAPGAIFDTSVNIISKPTYFTDVVIFGNEIKRDFCCDSFDKDVLFNSNVSVFGTLNAKEINAEVLKYDGLLFDLSTNVVFNSNLDVKGDIDASGSMNVGGNMNVDGVLTADTLKITNMLQVQPTPLSQDATDQLVERLFAQYDDAGNLVARGLEIVDFTNGVIFPGGFFGDNGSMFTKPVYFNNDVIFGGDIMRQDISIFTSNIEVIEDVHVGGDVQVNGTMNVDVSLNAEFLNITGGGAVVEGDVRLENDLHVVGQVTSDGTTIGSDRRIKRGIQDVRDGVAEDFVKRARVTEFAMKRHKPGEGAQHRYGLIAQELQEIDRRLVHTSSQFIPNVFKEIQVFQGKTITAPGHGLAQGDLVRFVAEGEKDLFGIVGRVVSDSCFELAEKLKFKKDVQYMLYGSYANDYLSVDFSQVVSLCLRAIQTLTARVERLERKASVSHSS